METNKGIGGDREMNVGTGQSSHMAASAAQRARQTSAKAAQTAGEVYEQTRQAVSDAYDKTANVLNDTYEQAVSYGKDNPGKTTLIAFGAGIGIGVLLAAGFGSSKPRRNRIVQPVINALSDIAMEVFR